MPLHHYLPATYLALFSTDTTEPRRKRILGVGDKETGKLFTASASQVAGINDLYTLPGAQSDSQIVDIFLSTYEPSFYFAVEQLINGQISAMAWASTLVPFIAALMVRGPDFNERFESRIASIGLENSSDNTNLARLMEIQRLLAPVAAAQWTLVQIHSDDPLITNDLGYAPFGNQNTREYGIAVPLGPFHILAIAVQTRKVLAFARNGEWLPMIKYAISPPNDHIQLNHVLASFAKRFVFGSDVSTLSTYFNSTTTKTRNFEPGQLGFLDGYLAMHYELSWHNLIIALSKKPSGEGDYIYMDFLKSSR